jgi:hypothetical protein
MDPVVSNSLRRIMYFIVEILYVAALAAQELGSGCLRDLLNAFPNQTFSICRY